MVKVKQYGWIGFIIIVVSFICFYFFFNGKGEILNYQEVNRDPVISPDYRGIVLPPNIAPLNFLIQEPGDRFFVKVYAEHGNPLVLYSENGKIIISQKKWKKLLQENKGEELYYDIYSKNEKGEWFKFNTISNRIAEDKIDPYLAYRLIEPLYILWGNIGIYQRNLENFDESPIFQNKLTNGGCMNCHSFNQQNPDNMMFHLRAGPSGTMIIRDGKITKVDTKIEETISAGVYPAWHPNGNLIAFSVNKIAQLFHAIPGKSKEVFDAASDIIVYNIDSNTVTSSPLIMSKVKMETFPCWSPDGKYLYYSSATVLDSIPGSNKLNNNQIRFDLIKYDLMRIAFDEFKNEWGYPEVLVEASKFDKSVSFPRVSPDGRYVMFCLSDYGNFSINHASSDLYLYDLEKSTYEILDVNSNETDSFHSWSGNNRWFVFSSKRDDGLFARFYLCYFDKTGKPGKPFILPQEDPTFYSEFLKSYNIPEFIKGKVTVSAWDLAEIANSEDIIQAKLDPRISIDALSGSTARILKQKREVPLSDNEKSALENDTEGY